ncbi:MAG: integration host factor subunit alpha [Succinivibrionaceae bacterium]
MSVTKADIIAHLINQHKLTQFEASLFVENFFEEMKKILEKGDALKISGFGSFSVHRKSPRPGRNPKTGEEVEISERSVVTFKMGNNFKDSESA